MMRKNYYEYNKYLGSNVFIFNKSYIRLRKLECYVSSSQLFVHWGESIDLVLNIRLFIFVQMNFDNLRAVKLHTNSFAYNLYGVDNILQQSVVHRSQRTTSRTLLLVLRTRLSRRLRQDFPFADEHYVLAGELLLQLAYQPRLDLLESLEFRHRYVYDDRLLIVCLQLLRLGDGEFP